MMFALLQNGSLLGIISMNDNYKGGILLTALLVVFLFSFIFIQVLDDFQLTQQFTQKTKEYYIAKTMVSMLLSDVKQGNAKLKNKGQQNFSAGIVHYEYDRAVLTFVVQLNQKTYKFQEEYQENEIKKIQLKNK